jgi:hypothetical protein
MPHPSKNYFLHNLIIASCVFLDVLVGLTSGLTTNINSIFAPKLASSSATVPLTVATNAYISLLVASTFLAMSSLTNPLFHSISPHHLLPPSSKHPHHSLSSPLRDRSHSPTPTRCSNHNPNISPSWVSRSRISRIASSSHFIILFPY